MCASSEQATKMFEIFNSQYSENRGAPDSEPILMAAEPQALYGDKKQDECNVKTSALILP